MKQEKTPLQHLIEGAEFWLERVKSSEELLAGELLLNRTREEMGQDLIRYADRLYDVAEKIHKAVKNEQV